ncbi:MAG: flagellar export chaperone FliS [Pseudomonadota bacterium]
MKYANAFGARAYADIGRHASVEAASPHRLIQMLFDGALDRIANAQGHIGRGDIAGKGHDIGRAIGIVEGLRMSLDRSVDHPLTANLDQLYDYICRCLLRANLESNAALLAESAGLLRELKTAWDAIPEGYRHGVPVPASQPYSGMPAAMGA